MGRTIVFEIGTEEIPARFMPDIMSQLSDKAHALFEEERIPFGTLHAMGTPRRLVLWVEDCAQEQDDLVRTVRGPSKRIAYAEDGAPTKAAIGFAKGQGVEPASLIIEEVDGTDYVFASIKKAGKKTADILANLLMRLTEELNFPKNMLWGRGEHSFVRPIRWVLALFDDEIIPVRLAGLDADRYTRGHRVLSEGLIRVRHANEYVQVLEAAHVMVDVDKRRRRILKEIEETASEHNGYIQHDGALVEEVVWLVEYPTAFCGSFHPDYLGLPEEAIITPMKEHQRYFPVVDSHNRLKPLFVGVRNGDETEIGTVTRGNEKVLLARLEDARFFWEEDLARGLEGMGEKLSRIVFQERLGSYEDKVSRIETLAVRIASALGWDEGEISLTARYCKNDLTSHMVNEFPELQGIMGEYYAREAGLSEAVSQGIREHYLPRFQDDALPAHHSGAAVAIADKIDSIVGIMGVGLIPSGSQDPYALRRAAQGVLLICEAMEIDLDMADVIDWSADLYNGLIETETAKRVREFFGMRVRKILLDRGISHDQVEAVAALPSLAFHDTLLRAEAIRGFSRETRYRSLVEGIKRATNLGSKGTGAAFDEALLQEEPERRLAMALAQTGPQIRDFKRRRAYDQALALVLDLKEDIDHFLEHTMVMVEEEEIRENRLALLADTAALTADIADFNRIVAKE